MRNRKSYKKSDVQVAGKALYPAVNVEYHLPNMEEQVMQEFNVAQDEASRRLRLMKEREDCCRSRRRLGCCNQYASH